MKSWIAFRVGCVAAAVIVAMAGCGGEADQDNVVHFWQFWDVAVIEPMIAEFEAENPDIKVKVEQLTWQSGLEKIQAALASGTQPDLCELGSTWLPRFSYEGVLMDMTHVYEEIGDDYLMWESTRWDGKVYGLPWVQGSRVLFWNRDLFSRAGMDPNTPPTTWDELLSAARKIDALGDDIYGFGLNLGNPAFSHFNHPVGFPLELKIHIGNYFAINFNRSLGNQPSCLPLGFCKPKLNQKLTNPYSLGW